jgi:hypothetical protein
MNTSLLSPTQQLLFGCACVRIELLRKGREVIIATYDAFSINNENEVCFYWDTDFLLQPYGYYLGDIFINDEYCFTVEFRIRRCEAVVVACRTEREKACAPGCEDAIGKGPLGAIDPSCGVVPCIATDTIDTCVTTGSCSPVVQGDCTVPLPPATPLALAWAEPISSEVGPFDVNNSGIQQVPFEAFRTYFFKVLGTPIDQVTIVDVYTEQGTNSTLYNVQYDPAIGIGYVRAAFFLGFANIELQLWDKGIKLGNIQLDFAIEGQSVQWRPYFALAASTI